MVRPIVALLVALVAGCTVPQFDCGAAVPCARGSVQSCISHDRARCRYLFSDGTTAECASCDDCSAAEREIIAWCDNDDPLGSGSGGSGGSGGGGGASGPASTDLAGPDELRDMSVAPRDLATPAGDLALPALDFSTESGDLGCYPFGHTCGGDPNCCAQCCVGGCTIFGDCALQ
jgi:hypothetical protein